MGGLQEVRVDQHIEHAQALVVLDKAHATHVCGQIVNRGHAGTRLFAGLEVAQVEDLVDDVVKDLVPLIHGLNINGADSSGEARPEFGNQVSADEAAASGYQDLIYVLCINSYSSLLTNTVRNSGDRKSS